MTKKRRPYIKRFVKTSDGSTNFDVDTDPVPPGKKVVITHVSAKDETSAFTALQIGIVRKGYFHAKEEEKNPNADTWYWSKSEFHMYEGEKFRVRFIGTTSGDVLHVHIDGYMDEVNL